MTRARISAPKAGEISGRKAAFFSTIVFFVTCLVVLLIGEGGARVAYSLTHKDEAIPANHLSRCLNRAAEHAPRFTPGCRIPGLAINALGYRGPEQSRQSIGDKTRIMIIGESVAFGWGATANETTFPYVLEDILGRNEYAVINAGVPSRTLAQNIADYDTYGKSFDSSILIIFNAWNDVVNSTLHPDKVAAWLKREPYHPSLLGDPLNFLLDNSKLFYGLYTRIYLRYRHWSNPLQSYNQEIVTDYANHLREFVIRETERGRTVYLLTLPTYLNQYMSYQEYAQEVMGNGGIYANTRTLLHLVETFNKIIRSLDKRSDVKVIDLASHFDKIPIERRKSLFAGEVVHLSDPGQRLIAEIIAAALKEHERSLSRTQRTPIQ